MGVAEHSERQARLSNRRRSVWLRAIFALAVGIAWPYLEIRWKCRAGFEASEACVWGKAYFPLARWIEPLIIAPLLFLVFTLAARLWRSRPGDSGHDA